MPPRGSWRSFDDGRTGGSKGAFLRFAAASPYDLLWQIEEDAFYTGKWQTLFDELAATPADLLASFHMMPAGPLVAAAPWWLRNCAVGAAPCFAPPNNLRNLSPRAPPNDPAASPHFSRASFFGAPQSFLRFAAASRGACAVALSALGAVAGAGAVTVAAGA